MIYNKQKVTVYFEVNIYPSCGIAFLPEDSVFTAPRRTSLLDMAW